MHRWTRISLAAWAVGGCAALAQDALNLDPVATGLTAPIGMAHAGDGRLFIVEQRGTIRIVENGQLLPRPFLDVSSKLVEARPGFDERGLLGLAFHPQYASNGRFFIFYNAPRSPDIQVHFDESDITNGVPHFTFRTIQFSGGIVGAPTNPAHTSSGTKAWQIPAGGNATIQLAATVSFVRMFFVHPSGASPGSVQAVDGTGTNRGTPVPSRAATVPGDPANFVTINQERFGIKELRFTAPPGQGFTLFVDDLQVHSLNSRTLLAEYRVSADPNIADPDSERLLLEVPKPQFNHNGGQLAFGPDGYLYISAGDGGGANDGIHGHAPEGNGQNVNTLLGKLLRIDVNSGNPYGIPPDNPFVGRPGLDEIYAYGLRNPWRFSFDRQTGRLFCADVGQNLFEEVDIIERGGNYGWRVREGLHCFDPANPTQPPPTCPDRGPFGEPLLDPIHEYGRTVGISVTGGYVYRGTRMPGLVGQYIFGDWSRSFSQADGSLFRLEETSPGQWERFEFEVRRGARAAPRLGRFVSAFGEDVDGELYVCTQTEIGFGGTTGVVFRISQAPGASDIDRDGCVGQADLGILLSHWLQTVPPNTQGDLNGDGVVNQADLGILLADWNAGCP